MPGQDVILETVIIDDRPRHHDAKRHANGFRWRERATSIFATMETRANWDEGYYRLVGRIVNFTDQNWAFYLEDCSAAAAIPVIGTFIGDAQRLLTRPVDLPALNIIGWPFWWFSVIAFVVAFLIASEGSRHWSIATWTKLIWLIFTGCCGFFCKRSELGHHQGLRQLRPGDCYERDTV